MYMYHSYLMFFQLRGARTCGKGLATLKNVGSLSTVPETTRGNTLFPLSILKYTVSKIELYEYGMSNDYSIPKCMPL